MRVSVNLMGTVYKGEKPATPEQAEYLDGVGLELLDALPEGDPRRDDICKRLSWADRKALMTRYGFLPVGRTWRAEQDQ